MDFRWLVSKTPETSDRSDRVERVFLDVDDAVRGLGNCLIRLLTLVHDDEAQLHVEDPGIAALEVDEHAAVDEEVHVLHFLALVSEVDDLDHASLAHEAIDDVLTNVALEIADLVLGVEVLRSDDLVLFLHGTYPLPMRRECRKNGEDKSMPEEKVDVNMKLTLL